MDITQITRPSEILFEQLTELTELTQITRPSKNFLEQLTQLTELTQITTWSRGDGPGGPDITELRG